MNNSFHAKATLSIGGRKYEIFRLDALAKEGFDISRLPYSLRVLLENLLRNEDGVLVSADDIRALAGWKPGAEPEPSPTNAARRCNGDKSLCPAELARRSAA